MTFTLDEINELLDADHLDDVRMNLHTMMQEKAKTLVQSACAGVTKSEQAKPSQANGAVAEEKKPTDRERMIHAWRTLYYGNLLSEKEKENIAKKLNKKYKA